MRGELFVWIPFMNVKHSEQKKM